MKKTKLDMRYARNRNRQPVDDAAADPPLYRSDLFRKAKPQSGVDFRNAAARCGISVNTFRDVLAGDATKLAPIAAVAKYFGIPWLAVFDVDRRLVFEPGSDRPGIAVASQRSNEHGD